MISRAGELAAIVLCAVVLGAIAITQFAPERETPGDGVPVFSGNIPDTVGPVTYFVNNCSRCHGPADNAYSEFNDPKRGDALRVMIKTMADGPAMAASDEQTIQQQYDLHIAILDKLPYVWLDPNSQDVIAGEIIPGTTVTLETPTGPIRAAIDDHAFALPNEPGKIVVTRSGKRAVIEREQGD